MSKNRKIQQYNNNHSSVVQHQSVSFSGPLPHPDILKKFDEVYPGAAKIIIDMAKEQSEHRQILEKTVINSDIRNSKLGLIFGFIIGMTGIVAGVVVIVTGQVAAGSILFAGTLGVLVGTFVYGSQGRRKEREDKDKK
jgi:uncharacterized membrane protein